MRLKNTARHNQLNNSLNLRHAVEADIVEKLHLHRLLSTLNWGMRINEKPPTGPEKSGQSIKFHTTNLPSKSHITQHLYEALLNST